jgi:hypothetical protein
MKYDMYPSLWEDIDSGAVWISYPLLTSRMIAKVRNMETGRTVYCEVKMVDEYYMERYGAQPGRSGQIGENPIFASAWYRKQLGIQRREGDVDLHIEEAESIYGKVCACLHHPQVVVRIATVLGLWSVVLGAIGLALGVT